MHLKPTVILKPAQRHSSEGYPVNELRNAVHTWRIHEYLTGIDAVQWAIEAEKRGAGDIMLTSMDRDGTKDGFDIELTKAISDSVNIPVIASGGCGNPEHILEVLRDTNASAALAASIFHFEEYMVGEVKECLRDGGVHVRL